MPYELLVSWRYLRTTRRGRGRTGALAAFLAVTALGAALFALAPGAKEVGVLLLVFGSIGVVAAALAHFFSAFTTVAILGVALGVRVLGVVLSVTSGFEGEFMDKVLGVNAHVLVMKYGLDFSEYREVMTRVRQVPGVRAAAPFVIREMMLVGRGEPLGVLLKGVDPAQVGDVLDLPEVLVEGRVGDLVAADGAGGLPGIFLGRELARRVRAGRGDVVQLMAPADWLGSLARAGDSPRTAGFRVAGIFHAGFGEYDQRLAYVHLAEAQRLLGRGDVVMGVEMKVADVFGTGALLPAIERALGGGPYRLEDWRELNRNLFTALRMQKGVLAVVIALIMLVAAFNIIATLTILVLRRTREFAILQAMGTPGAGIRGICRAAGGLIGAIGTALGLAWALSDCALVARYGYPLDPTVYLIGQLPVRPSPAELSAIAGIALLTTLAATVYPARRATALRPVEGLRYE